MFIAYLIPHDRVPEFIDEADRFLRIFHLVEESHHRFLLQYIL